MAENIVGVQISQKPSKMAFYKYVLASTNGLKMNDVIEDWRHCLAPSLARRHRWDGVYYIAS